MQCFNFHLLFFLSLALFFGSYHQLSASPGRYFSFNLWQLRWQIDNAQSRTAAPLQRKAIRCAVTKSKRFTLAVTEEDILTKGLCYGQSYYLLSLLQIKGEKHLARVLASLPYDQQALVNIFELQCSEFRRACESPYALSPQTHCLLKCDDLSSLCQKLETLEQGGYILRTWVKGARIGHCLALHVNTNASIFEFYDSRYPYGGLFSYPQRRRFLKAFIGFLQAHYGYWPLPTKRYYLLEVLETFDKS